MTLLSLAQAFGAGASQDADELVIQKAALTGLTATANNSAESLLAALLLTLASQIRGRLETEGGDPITTEAGAPITFDNSADYRLDCYPFSQGLTARGGSTYRQRVFVLHFWLTVVPFNSSLDPDLIDYADFRTSRD